MNDVLDMLANFINENLQLKQLSDFEYATILSINPLSIQLASNKILTIDFLEFTQKTQYLANSQNELDIGFKVLIAKKQGGQQFIILDVFDVTLSTTSSTIVEVSPLKIELKNGKILEDNTQMIFASSLSYLRTTEDIENIGKKLITTRNEKGNYVFVTMEEG